MAAPRSAGIIRRWAGKLFFILYTQMLVAIFVTVCFTIYRSTQVIGASSSDHPEVLVPIRQHQQNQRQATSLSSEAKVRQEALARLQREAQQFELEEEDEKENSEQTKKDSRADVVKTALVSPPAVLNVIEPSTNTPETIIDKVEGSGVSAIDETAKVSQQSPQSNSEDQKEAETTGSVDPPWKNDPDEVTGAVDPPGSDKGEVTVTAAVDPPGSNDGEGTETEELPGSKDPGEAETATEPQQSISEESPQEKSIKEEQSEDAVEKIPTKGTTINIITGVGKTKTTEQEQDDDGGPDDLLVQKDDFIYQKKAGESAPIVVEEFRLIFFAQAKVGCTVWKMLFRRMMGENNWKDNSLGLPHVPEKNGLKYLYHYNRTYASHILQSPHWTRAIFVRDPKERFLSAYLDKAVEEMLFVDTCCNRIRRIHCDPSPPSIQQFLDTIRTCRDSHWDPQITRMESKFWKTINFVGHLETAQEDAKRLLRKLHVWDHFGLTGWGKNGDQSMFGSTDGLRHSNNAKSKVEEYLYPELEQEVEAFYEADYRNPLFGYNHTTTLTTKITNTTNSTNMTTLQNPRPLVEPRDWIYRKARKHGEAAPIVVEKYKLIFFAVPHVADYEFKQLFQRMMGVENWRKRNYHRIDYDQFNVGLTFLYDYNLTYASHIMTSPQWTRAIFTRDPKERFVHAYTQTAVGARKLLHSICCFKMPRMFCLKKRGKNEAPKPKKEKDMPSAKEFLEGLTTCKSTHWDPMTERLAAVYRLGLNSAQKQAFNPAYFVKSKYWKYLNFVGKIESAAHDTKRLLERVGAWDEFGASGWGDEENDDATTGRDSIFTSTSFQQQELKLKKELLAIISEPEMEEQVERVYEKDYRNRYLNLTRKFVFSLEGKKTFRDEIKELEEGQDDGQAIVKREW